MNKNKHKQWGVLEKMLDSEGPYTKDDLLDALDNLNAMAHDNIISLGEMQDQISAIYSDIKSLPKDYFRREVE